MFLRNCIVDIFGKNFDMLVLSIIEITTKIYTHQMKSHNCKFEKESVAFLV